MDPSTIATIILGIVTGIVAPAVGRLFGKFGKLDDKFDQISDRLEKERDERRALELRVATEYVNRASLREALEPLSGKLNHLDRMMERIASRLSVPTGTES